ncbi:glycosyl hydrolase [Paenibacillus oralis]|uniref:Glycosyl hydrolase n=1 Tax=Paenibacillus oralis TaxID=2490856 RepID=A0A3P3U2H4_9BACL|nr:glycosyl hydrolase [Paenibacillus oralis]RRJ62773.1 glycosyl hydrolase [Paenibacillus oralis]
MEVNSLEWRSRRNVLWVAIVLLLGASLGIGGCRSHAEGKESTKRFIAMNLTNPNGTLATYLQEAEPVSPELAAGREALSESLGLWMQAALESHDLDAFEKSYETLTRHFTTDRNYIAWKLNPEGGTEVSTNALGDDLRIIGALLEGTRTWEGHPEWKATAKTLTETLLSRSQKNGFLVDFYDFSRQEAPDTLALAYVDLSVLKELVQEGMLDEETYGRYHALLQDMPDDGVFYPKSFNVVTGEYTYETTVNLIDQLLVAIHAGETERDQEPLLQFLKQKFKQTGKLSGQYVRAGRTAAVNYESPSVYGLAIKFAIDRGDKPFAKALYKHMLTLKGRDAKYPGGYVFAGNTHIFDNLLPLLGEYALANH